MSLCKTIFSGEIKKILYLLLFAFCWATTLSAQSGSAVVSIPKQKVKVSEVLAEIERQTQSVIAFDLNKLNVSRRIELTKTEGTISEWLDQVLAGTDLSYTITGRYIVLLSASETPAKKIHTVAPAVGVSGPSPAPNFEQNVQQYTESQLTKATPDTVRSIQYDTVVRTTPHDGVFAYPEQSKLPQHTGQAMRSSFPAARLPLLLVKTNLAYWATLTPNLSGEIGLGKTTSLEVMGSNNRWNLEGSNNDNKKLVHWLIKPEFRYWLCERFNGHFFGLHAFYGKYNISGHTVPLLFEKKYRYEGDLLGGGISYGYHWMWSKRWGMEFNVGIGAASLDYTKHECVKCGKEVEHTRKTYIGPTGAGLKLIFVIH